MQRKARRRSQRIQRASSMRRVACASSRARGEKLAPLVKACSGHTRSLLLSLSGGLGRFGPGRPARPINQNAARRIAAVIKRLTSASDQRSVAYVGESRMIDLSLKDQD